MMQGMKRGNNNRINEAGPNIWGVVASLAHALSDARDQLVDLINYDGYNARGFHRGHGLESTHRSNGEGTVHHTDNAVAMRCRGGGGRGCCGNYVPSNKGVRSVHRQHARGHVAFGNHSEFKPELFSSKPCKPVTMAVNYSPARGGCGRPSSRVNISFNPRSQQCTSRKESNCRSPSPAPYECKRHCIGHQYVAVLRQEACHLRKRRLEKQCENSNAKPRWARC
ncbi:hypothetical protein KC19_2G021000 [Ceratodon purpureus]|uniref:Uncharacterized protein n=1 Tax=Ceratodon purpureus TaxID=3225 RepID=A0A8T0IQV6_CERPU|nr:hypothetical protein KC19_2G021000 [Ceratodon purpureus]